MTTEQVLAQYTLAGVTAKGKKVYKHYDAGCVLTMKNDTHGTQYHWANAEGYSVGSYDGKAVLAAMVAWHNENLTCADLTCGKCGDCADHSRRMAEYEYDNN